MKKRIPLSKRQLPSYTKREEIMNMVTHIIGGGLGFLALTLCILVSCLHQNIPGVIGSAIYGGSMIILYAISSVYHGLIPCTGKKVMQVIDHCSIYILIAGTYTPILLSAFLPLYPILAWSLLVLEWGFAALAITLTAIDLRNYRVFSMICYIFMGWAIIFFVPQAIIAFTPAGFYWLLSGGIAYTIGAILYGIGVKRRWMHSVFHIFVVLGSLLQFISILFYVL